MEPDLGNGATGGRKPYIREVPLRKAKLDLRIDLPIF
jgi:hypothetical protein